MPHRSRRATRRTVLQLGIAGSLSVVAGCLAGDDSTDGEGTPTATADGTTPTGTVTDTAGTPTGDGGDSTDESGDDQPTPTPVESHEFTVETVTESITFPWGLAFLPGSDRLLVTELPGALTLVDREDGTTEEIGGTPEVLHAGQGGLLDVTLHPSFPDPAWVYLTYSTDNSAGESATALGRGRLDVDDAALAEFEELHVAEPYVDSSAHYGSRVVFGEEGMAYVTSGDRQFKNFGPDHVAQDLTNELGAILRLEPDGSIPEDNPFVGDDDAADSIYSYGHRNPQGLTVHPETGDLWATEHGEEDGDEINVIRAGENYGWPVADTGCEYGTDDPVADADDTERDDVVGPVHHWECGSGGFPPAGASFYDGEQFPNWQGDLFVGNLAGQYLGRFVVRNPDGDVALEEVDPLLADRDWRVRQVAVEPDTGHLYVAVDGENGPVARLIPDD